MQPHFLFNTLHALSGLILRGDNDAAAGMLTRLSGLLRASFAREGEQSATLGSELDLVNAYLEIHKTRYGERLRSVVETDAGVEQAAVPSFLLQPLVENAIRHGVAVVSRPVTVWLTARRQEDELILGVEDDGPGLPDGWASSPHEGVGWSNTRRRLEYLYPGDHRLEIRDRPGGGTAVWVVLPYSESRPETEDRFERAADPDRR
jgi:LytS/YehU family sensor histidine kinase